MATFGGRFGRAWSSATADFSEVKSSSDVDNWREFPLFPLPPNGRIAPVESDRLWFPLVLDTEVRLVFRVLVFRRRNNHRANAAIRKRTAPPTTPPAMAPLFTDELPTINGVVVTDGPIVEGGKSVEAGVVGEVEDDGVEDCDGVTTQDTSSPLVTLKILDGMAPAVA